MSGRSLCGQHKCLGGAISTGNRGASRRPLLTRRSGGIGNMLARRRQSRPAGVLRPAATIPCLCRWRCCPCCPRCAHLLRLGWRWWIQSSSWLLPRLRCWALALGESRRDCRCLSERWCAPIIRSRDGRFATAGRSRRHELDDWVGSLHLATGEETAPAGPAVAPAATREGSRRLLIPHFLSAQSPLSLSLSSVSRSRLGGERRNEQAHFPSPR